tara:strand:- start:519 stop:1949 length:1431 start_codon:yes stop_codon:yes gene_type:complete
MKAEDFTIKTIEIRRVGEDNAEEPFAILTNVVLSFQYFEDITLPSVSATLLISDKAANLPSAMPIQGFELVTMIFTDRNGKDHQYEFRVWKVGNRVSTEKGQGYLLGLISTAGLINEGVKVNALLKGTANTIVKKVLQDYLNVPEAKVRSDEATNIMKIFPAGKSPFAVIRDLQNKSISKDSFASGGNTANSNIGDNSGASITSSSDTAEDTTQLKGSAGYFFWETIDGFNFRSIDSLTSKDPKKFGGSESVATYEYAPAMVEATESLNPWKIQEITFTSELDLLRKLREGAYSTECTFFDINTGVLKEYTYKLSENWDKMGHLGTSTKLPWGQTALSQYPTRRLSSVINHELWYNGTEIASNESEAGSDEPSEITDNQKQFLVQSIARAGSLFNQQLMISVPGNLNLRAGDKITVMIPNQIPEKLRESEGDYDPEHSGVYLIKKLNHQFDRIQMNVYTVLELIRDCYGYEETETK